MKICPKCSTSHEKPGVYCSRPCANSRIKTDEVKAKVSAALKGVSHKTPFSGVNVCEICKAQFTVNCFTRKNRTCSPECANTIRVALGRVNGCKSASATSRRSKNEVHFAELCKTLFEIKTNEQIFNGWDADVIIPSIKVAVMWNGAWHYKQVTKKHSLLQVQTRDAIKAREIEKAGYTLYVVRDDGSHSVKFVNEQFEKFKTWLGETGYHATLIKLN